MKHRTPRRTTIFFIIISSGLGWTSCSSDASPSADTDTGTETAHDTDPVDILLTDENNFSFESSLSLSSIETAAAPDIEICWENLTRDFQCHEMDPIEDVDNVSLVRIRNMTEEEIAASLSEGDLPQSYITGYLDFPADKETPCALLADFSFRGSEVDVAEEYTVSETEKYLLVLTTGTQPGVGARMMAFLTPSETSEVTRVDIEEDCDALAFDADLGSLTTVDVPKDGNAVMDWSYITRNGQSGGVSFGGIDSVLIGFYESLTPAALEDAVLDLLLIADRTYELPLEGGSFSALLTDAEDAEGNAFDGFEGDGTWIFALMCSSCQNPAPQFLTVLTPTDTINQGEDTDSESDEEQQIADALFSDISVEPAEDMPTVLRVTWTTESPTIGRVRFGTDKTLTYETPVETEASTEHSALLLGIPPHTRIYYRLTAADEDDEVESNIASTTTGNLPDPPPDFTVEGEGPGFVLAPVIGTTGTGVLILDAEGRPVWYRVDDRGLDIYRVRLSHDGTRLVYNAASVSGDPSEASEIMSISLDGSDVFGIPVPLLAHDFVELEDGSFGALTAEYRDVGGEEIMGNQIVEVTRDGTITTIWSTWDCFDPAETTSTATSQGWTFANALDYDPVEDVYYIGLHTFSSIVKVDRATGECRWVFGNTAETIGFENGAPRFLHQHQFQVLDDGILVFDNDGALGNESRVVEYAFDFDAGTASAVWEYTADPAVYTFVLGEPIRLNDGSTFINWSASGQMNWVTPEGEMLFQLNAPLGNAFGFNTLETSLYRN